jgi:hypothetical protein
MEPLVFLGSLTRRRRTATVRLPSKSKPPRLVGLRRSLVRSDCIADLRKEFDRLLTEAKALFEEVERDHPGFIIESFPPHLSDERRSWIKDIRHWLRGLLARLAMPLPESPLLDKQDFRRFVRLGGAMDAALDFKAYRGFGLENSDDRLRASWIFKDACEEIDWLLDLVPESRPQEPATANQEPSRSDSSRA